MKLRSQKKGKSCISRLRAVLFAELLASDEVYVQLRTITGVTEIFDASVKLRMCLYDLRHAPNLWYEKLAKILKKIGLIRSAVNEAIFVCGKSGSPVYVVDYIDDILVVGDQSAI